MKHSKLARFTSIPPKFSKPQAYGMEWLAQAHARSEHPEPTEELEKLATRMRKLIARVCSSSAIGFRSSELEDFSHLEWEKMRIFAAQYGPKGAGAADRMKVYQESTERVLSEFYPEGSSAPEAIIHVTCTGYVSPSAAQSLVARRGWHQSTVVTHAYHMGCAAAFPALRIALGFNQQTDIVHTELCTLHLNPSNHSLEQLVVQTLFADGFIRYSTVPASSTEHGLEVVQLAEEIVPHSETAMTWSMADFGMQMTLSRDVPELIQGQLEGFLHRMFEAAGLDFARCKAEAAFAIHPGGPRIIEQIQQFLELREDQVQWSREVLFERGNMSSATLPHVWKKMLESKEIPSGRLIVSMAFAPGLTICGGILRKS